MVNNTKKLLYTTHSVEYRSVAQNEAVTDIRELCATEVKGKKRSGFI